MNIGVAKVDLKIDGHVLPIAVLVLGLKAPIKII